ncbi:hypothetical protein ACHAXA_006467 [Cyclostephanos tholiformis]|uniref:Glycosyltransferase family 92 protein n=1 Tax=Cyclostephanos tholiformis TaxID=382380 RepID=A0ABD3RBN7_9STRA
MTSAHSPVHASLGCNHGTRDMMKNVVNGRMKLHGVMILLSMGLIFTFLTSVALIAWHERALMIVSSSPSGKDVVRGGGGGGGAGDDGMARGRDRDGKSSSSSSWPLVLSAYVESSHSTDAWYDENDHDGPSPSHFHSSSGGDRPRAPLPPRRTSSRELTRILFGHRVSYTTSDDTSNRICRNVPSLLPVDEFGSSIQDPYLPWIHDLFASADGKRVEIVAQNRRRCHKGKYHVEEMRYWEGQVALLQPVAVRRVRTMANNRSNDVGDGEGVRRGEEYRYRLSTHEEADVDGIETRFICVFKSIDYEGKTTKYEGETLSTYPFNYEFVNWRKQSRQWSRMTRDNRIIGYRRCYSTVPPDHLQKQRRSTSAGASSTTTTNDGILLDIVPIRTPVRRNDHDGYFFHDGHGGPMTFNATRMWGRDHVLPRIEDSGRWENLPVCSLPRPTLPPSVPPDDGAAAAIDAGRTKAHRLVACTWTSAVHQRRGNERRIADGKARLREWIAFNLEVGFDHVYVFDNTGANATIFRLKNEVVEPEYGNDTSSGRWTNNGDLSSVTDLFPPTRVTRIDWPATVCNNNRPAHNDPGERSSQYAAEAACRSRYGPYTDWMASMDPDEYFVPMGSYTNWKQLLDKIDSEEGVKVLKFRSTRARPLLSTLVPTFDDGVKECTREMAKKHNQCMAKADDSTYLETYNCEYIKSPKPERFSRAMKQFYRPDFVLLHYVHYSTVTTDLATEKRHTVGAFIRHASENPKIARFVDELEEGVLIHAKTTVPAETFSREEMCVLNAPSNCLVGIPCPDHVEFDDALHTKNVFRDENGNYCNCWMNHRVEEYWLPKLYDALSKIGTVS